MKPDQLALLYTEESQAVNQFRVEMPDLMRLFKEAATKGDLLGQEEWTGSFSASSLFSSKPATARRPVEGTVGPV